MLGLKDKNYLEKEKQTGTKIPQPIPLLNLSQSP
jgi:hypothetical protein